MDGERCGHTHTDRHRDPHTDPHDDTDLNSRATNGDDDVDSAGCNPYADFHAQADGHAHPATDSHDCASSADAQPNAGGSDAYAYPVPADPNGRIYPGLSCHGHPNAAIAHSDVGVAIAHSDVGAAIAHSDAGTADDYP